MKNKIKRVNLLILLTLILLMILGFASVIRIRSNFINHVVNSPAKAYKIYTSRRLKIILKFPSKYQQSESVNAILLDYQPGQIQIVKQDTNYRTLDEYLKSIDVDIEKDVKLQIDGYPAINTIINDRMYYFIYVNYSVYSLSTSSPALYSDLDKITRDFKYNP